MADLRWVLDLHCFLVLAFLHSCYWPRANGKLEQLKQNISEVFSFPSGTLEASCKLCQF